MVKEVVMSHFYLSCRRIFYEVVKISKNLSDSKCSFPGLESHGWEDWERLLNSPFLTRPLHARRIITLRQSPSIKTGYGSDKEMGVSEDT
jgi:hypothetical protein